MAAVGFRFRAAVCLLAAILLWTSSANGSLKADDGWSLPDTTAVVGKLFRYRVTSDQPCAAHYKVLSSPFLRIASDLSDFFSSVYVLVV